MMEAMLPYSRFQLGLLYSLCNRCIMTSRLPHSELCKLHSNLLRGAHQVGDPPVLTSSHLLVF